MAVTELKTEARSDLKPRLPLLTPSYLGQVAAIAALYVLAARAGLRLDAVSGFAAIVWPPTGIALAAVLLGGPRIWPGIFIGALVANVLTGAPTLAAAGVATGNTLEAVVGAFALKRVTGFRPGLDRLRDVIALIVFAALLATMISATASPGRARKRASQRHSRSQRETPKTEAPQTRAITGPLMRTPSPNAAQPRSA